LDQLFEDADDPSSLVLVGGGRSGGDAVGALLGGNDATAKVARVLGLADDAWRGGATDTTWVALDGAGGKGVCSVSTEGAGTRVIPEALRGGSYSVRVGYC
jgi:hypothetical protein